MSAKRRAECERRPTRRGADRRNGTPNARSHRKNSGTAADGAAERGTERERERRAEQSRAERSRAGRSGCLTGGTAGVAMANDLATAGPRCLIYRRRATVRSGPVLTDNGQIGQKKETAAEGAGRHPEVPVLAGTDGVLSCRAAGDRRRQLQPAALVSRPAASASCSHAPGCSHPHSGSAPGLILSENAARSSLSDHDYVPPSCHQADATPVTRSEADLCDVWDLSFAMPESSSRDHLSRLY